MAGFSLIKDTQEPTIEEWTISSLTIAVGDLLYKNTGADTVTVGAAAAESFEQKGIATEAATSSDTLCKVIIVGSSQLWEADAANNSNASHNGQNMILSDQNTVNNTGTNDTSSEACVTQVGVAGAAADKRILVRFENTGYGLSNM